jgi:hypothetical protein
LFSVLAVGCSQEKTTPELIADLKTGDGKDRIVAVRTLPRRRGDAAQTVPALIEALKSKDTDIRSDAAIGLGSLGESAKEAVPALQALLGDRDVRVREAAGIALTRIDPAQFPEPPKQTAARKR